MPLQKWKCKIQSLRFDCANLSIDSMVPFRNYGTLTALQFLEGRRKTGKLVLHSTFTLVTIAFVILMHRMARPSMDLQKNQAARFLQLGYSNASHSRRRSYRRNAPKTNNTYFVYHRRRLSKSWKEWLDTHKDYESQHLHLWLNNNNGPEPIRNLNPLGDDMIR